MKKTKTFTVFFLLSFMLASFVACYQGETQDLLEDDSEKGGECGNIPTICSRHNLEGTCRLLRQGGEPDLATMGLRNDVDSIMIPDGFMITAWEYPDYERFRYGPFATNDGDCLIYNLDGNTGINDWDSVRIEHTDPEDWVEIFSYPNGQRERHTLKLGEYSDLNDNNRTGTKREWRNDIDSIKIPPGLMITAWEYPGFRRRKWGPFTSYDDDGPMIINIDNDHGMNNWDSIIIEPYRDASRVERINGIERHHFYNAIDEMIAAHPEYARDLEERRDEIVDDIKNHRENNHWNSETINDPVDEVSRPANPSCEERLAFFIIDSFAAILTYFDINANLARDTDVRESMLQGIRNSEGEFRPLVEDLRTFHEELPYGTITITEYIQTVPERHALEIAKKYFQLAMAVRRAIGFNVLWEGVKRSFHNMGWWTWVKTVGLMIAQWSVWLGAPWAAWAEFAIKLATLETPFEDLYHLMFNQCQWEYW